MRIERGRRRRPAPAPTQGYNYTGGPGNWLSDAGVTHRDVWGPASGSYFISGGSHAGHAADDGEPYRWTPGDAVRLVPLEPIAGH